MARIKPGKAKRSPMVMVPEKKLDARDKMTWFLDFLNADIDSFRLGDRSKLFFDLMEFIHGDVVLEPPSGYVIDDDDKDFLRNAQEAFRQALANILKAAEGCRVEDVEYTSIAEYSVAYLVVISKDSVFKARYSQTSQGQIFDVLIELLSQFHLSRIRTCQKPDCGKYFYRKREGAKGDFCSNRCRNWGYTTRWRQAHPDKYDDYQKTYRSNRKNRAKQARIEVRCGRCEFRESRGLLKDYLKNYSDPGGCPQCGKPKLWHIVIRWDKDERDWVREVYDEKEWDRYLKKIQIKEGSHG